MKKLVLVVMVVTLVLLVSVVWARGVKPDSGLEVSLGILHLTDGDARNVAGTGFGVDLRRQVYEGIGSKADINLYASIGYIKFSDTWHTIDVSATVVPIMATAIKADKNGIYYGVGLGLAVTRLELSGSSGSGSTSETDFAYQLLAGKNFSEKYFAEVKYFNGGIAGNTGLGVNIGAKF